MKLGTLVSKTPLHFGAHWWMLAVTALLFVLVAVFVDLKPVVEESFFFSTRDPGFGQSKKIEKRFPSQPQLILAVSSRDISSPRYLDRIRRLTQQVQAIDAVNTVKSLTAGTSAVLLTLLVQQMFAEPIWILIVNLGTIVFIVALSLLVYMTFNWRTLADRTRRLGKESPDLAADARRMTFPPSFWSMVCAS